MSSFFEERPLLLYCGLPLLLVSSLKLVVPEAVDKLALIVANTLITHTYVWNLVTSCFYEESWLKLVIDLIFLYGVASKVAVESLEQFLLYFVFNVLACTIGSSAYCISRFALSEHEYPLVLPMYGFNGILMCLMVFVWRHQGGQPVHPVVPGLTYQTLPLAFLLLQLTLLLIGLRSFTRDFLFALLSLLFSWSYLRFYYKFDDLDAISNRKDEFTFVSMFPEAVHIVVVPFTTAFYNLMALVGLFPALEVVAAKPSHHLRPSPAAIADAGSSPRAAGAAAVVDMVGERRRAKAMKLLDAKMAELSR
eukprot:gene41263-50360_t